MNSDPKWDEMSSTELATLTAISARASATTLKRIEFLLGIAVGMLGLITARYLGWY